MGCIALPSFLILTACGGGGNDVPSTDDTDTTAPTVGSITPEASATGVARNTAVTATFVEDMFSTTIDGASFTLANATNTTNVSGSTHFNEVNNVATFTPNSDLAILAPYTATLSASITDLSGNTLPTYSWSFTTADGTWSDTNLLEARDGFAYKPQITVDTTGNAIAVWEQNSSIYSKHYTISSGWGDTALLETGEGLARSPQIAQDATGNAIAVWYQAEKGSNGPNTGIYSNRYTVDSGWGEAVLLETDDGLAYNPQISLDATGNAIAVWTVQNDGGMTANIYSNRYTIGSGWDDAALLETGEEWADFPQITLNASGIAIAVWYQNDGAAYRIYSKHYTVNSGWGAAILLDTGDGNAVFPQVALNSTGNAIAVWEQSDGITSNIYSNRYTVGSGWGAAILLETGDGNANFPQIALNAKGNAIAVWHQENDTAFNIYSNRYAVDSGWSEAVLLATNVAFGYNPQIAIDATGNAITVWGQNDGTAFNIYSNRYTVNGGWDETALLETGDGSAYFPQIALDSMGTAIAVWEQRNKISPFNIHIYSIRFE